MRPSVSRCRVIATSVTKERRNDLVEFTPETAAAPLVPETELSTSTGTLLDAIAALERNTTLTPRRKNDFQSALRCFSRVLGLDPAATPASDLALFQGLIAALEPEAHAMSRERWSVIKSQVQRALVITGFALPMLTASTILLPAWERLFEGSASKHTRLALSRFARFCSQRGILPDKVSNETFDLFLKSLTTRSLVRNPRQVHRYAARAWNQLAGLTPGVSTAKISILPIIPRDRGLPRSSFSKSFQQDLEAFALWCASADPLDDDARAKRLRPQTIRSYCSALHSAACAAVKAGIAIESITSLSCLTNPSTYRAILSQLHAKAGHQPNAHATTIATIVFIMAKDWLRLPSDTIAELRRIKSKLPRIKQGLTPKNRALLGKFDETALRQRFLLLPDQLWREALSNKLPARSKLVRAQLAILLALLQIIPVRRKNVCGLAFGIHITSPNGPNAAGLLQLPSEETKTSEDYVAEIPLETAKWLQIYRTRIAPAVIGKEPVHLFVTAKGTLKRESCVAFLLEQTLLKRLGLKMSMHQFRHVGAKLMLDENPGAYETVAQLLGHAGTKNTIRYYGGVDTRRASRHHAKIIESLRADAGKTPPRRGGGTRRKTK